MRGFLLMKPHKTILYIEDDPDLIQLVSMILRREGFEVFGVTDSRMANEIVRKRKPEIILLDLMLPEIDGWQIYKHIKADQETRKIPVIIITARSQPAEQALGKFISGAAGYLCKPFQPDELIKTIQQVSRV